MGFGADHSGALTSEDQQRILDALRALRAPNALRESIAAEIAEHAVDDSEVSDAYRHAAMIAAGTWGAGGNA